MQTLRAYLGAVGARASGVSALQELPMADGEGHHESEAVMTRNYVEYRTVDKASWPRGEWDAEPDKAQWIDEASGLDCLIVRNRGGALCGYVGVPDGHPMFKVDYNSIDVQAHGGLTFAGMCADTSMQAFERWRSGLLSRRVEADQYPNGDAANAWKEESRFLDDYAGWLAFSETRTICHRSEPGRPDHVWWLGFDCAHSGDLSPKWDAGRFSSCEDSYKDWRYVTQEVASLCAQLVALEAQS